MAVGKKLEERDREVQRLSREKGRIEGRLGESEKEREGLEERVRELVEEKVGNEGELRRASKELKELEEEMDTGNRELAQVIMSKKIELENARQQI